MIASSCRARVILWGALLGSAGCSAAPSTQQQVATPALTATPPGSGDPQGPADAEEPIEHSMMALTRVLPQDTFFVVLGQDLFRLAEQFGRSALIERFSADHQDLVKEMRRDIGVDLTSPDGFAEIGLDPHGPAGVAVIWPDREVFGFLVSVTSPAKLYDRAREWKLEAEEIGGTTLLLPRQGGEFALVIEHSTALLLTVDGSDEARDVARQIGGLESHELLPKSESFTETMAGIPTDRDGLLYFNPNAAVRAMRGLPAVASGISGLGCALLLKGNELDCDLRIPMAKDSIFASIAKTARGTPEGGAPILHLLDQEPLLVLYASMDPDLTARELRNGLGPMWSMISAEVGVDFDNEVIPLLDGSVGMAIEMVDRGPRPKHLRPQETYARFEQRVTGVIGLRDVPGTERLLGRLTAQRKLTRNGRDYRDPSSKEGPFIGIRGETLVITNNEPRLRSVRDPAQVKGRWSWPTPGERQPFLLGFNPGAYFMGTSMDYMAPSSSPPPPQPGQAESAAVRAKRREIEQLEQQLAKLNAEYADQKVVQSGAIAARMGGMWLALGPGEKGLAGHAVYRVPARTFSEGIVEFVAAAKQEDELSSAHWQQVMEIQNRIGEKQSELSALRMQSGNHP